MQVIEIRFVFLFLFLYSAEAKLQECGENGVNADAAANGNPILPYQLELEELFDAFMVNDTERMEAAFKVLENIGINGDNDDESIANAEKPIKSVASSNQFSFYVLKIFCKKLSCFRSDKFIMR